jgi:hypothetical protein
MKNIFTFHGNLIFFTCVLLTSWGHALDLRVPLRWYEWYPNCSIHNFVTSFGNEKDIKAVKAVEEMVLLSLELRHEIIIIRPR